MLLKKGDAIALTACSDPIQESSLPYVNALCDLLAEWGLTVKNHIDQTSPSHKAAALMSAYRDSECQPSKLDTWVRFPTPAPE